MPTVRPVRHPWKLPALFSALAMTMVMAACSSTAGTPGAAPTTTTQDAAGSGPATSSDTPPPTTEPPANTAEPETSGSPEAPEPTIQEPEELPAGLEETDFGTLTWTFRPGGNMPETVQLEMADGAATEGSIQYSVGEVVLAELTGDDRIDAAVQLTSIDGNAFDEQWYLWVATDDGPAQVTLPIARMARCGNVTHSVTAVEGGVQVDESRRTIGDEGLSCADVGSDDRTRVVAAAELRNDGEWWPVQVGPIAGFGGLCPTAAEYEGVPYDGQVFAAPDDAAPQLSGGTDTYVFALEPWPVYGEPFPGWQLAGVKQGEVMACGWIPVP